jgi:hypothetical protein
MAKSNWSTPLPRPITIPQVMTLKTLADVRKLPQPLTAWGLFAQMTKEQKTACEIASLIEEKIGGRASIVATKERTKTTRMAHRVAHQA